MADNRPLFDDEQLPKWLTEAGITHAGQKSSAVNPARSPATAVPPAAAPSLLPPPAEVESFAPPAPIITVPPQSAPKPQSKPLKKLGPLPPPEADPNLTYEAWEQAQINKEQAALRTPEDDLLDAVPDYLNAAPAAAGNQPEKSTESGAGGVEFMPAWFAGLEDQSSENAPDWFKPDEIASTSLSGPMRTSAATTETPGGPAAPLPDWMRGDIGGDSTDLGGMNFDSLFDTSEATAMATPEPEIGGAPLSNMSPLDEMALDWMSDIPNLPDFDSQARPLNDPKFNPQSTLPMGESYDAFSSNAVPTASSDMSQTPGEPDDIPDWMRALTPDESPRAAASQFHPTGQGQPDLSANLEPEGGTVPDWLSGIGGPESGESSANAFAEAFAAQEPEVEAGNLPDWMADLQPANPSRSAPNTRGTSQRTPMANMPPDAAADARDAAAGLDLSGNVSSDDIDTLLNVPLPDSSALQSEPMNVSVPMDFGSLSLDESDLDEILGPVQAVPDAPFAVTALPSTPSAAVPRRPGRGGAAPVDPNAPIAKAHIPDSLLERISTDEPVRFAIGPIQVAVKEASLSALTDQLRQLRDRAVAFQAPPPSPTATAGPLADIAGTLAIEPIVVQAATMPSPAMTTGTVTDAQRQRVALIRHILEMDVVEAPESGSTASASAKASAVPRRATRIKVDRLVITLLLFAAMVAPFFTNVFNVVTPPDISAATNADSAVFKVNREIGKIASGHLVLMAFEYGPTGANEMDDLARVMLRELFKHGVKPIIVSTDFAGALHADALLNSFGRDSNELKALNRTSDKPLMARQDYVVLRYLPAGAAGVRSVVNAIYASSASFNSQTEFTLDVEGQPSGLNVATDLATLQTSPAIVLAETPEDVRNWAEQYKIPAGLPAGTAPARIILGVSAAAAAAARAYSTALSSTVIGPLIGLRDVTLYQVAYQTPVSANGADRLNQRWQSVGLGALVSALLILFGALFSLIGALRRQTKNGRLGQAQAGGRR